MDFDYYLRYLAPTVWASATNKPAVQALYPVAQESTPQDVYGKFYGQAVVYLALHMWDSARQAEAGGAGVAGPLTSASTGEYSKKTWAAPPMTADGDDMNSTQWGRARNRLLTNVSHGPVTGYP